MCVKNKLLEFSVFLGCFILVPLDLLLLCVIFENFVIFAIAISERDEKIGLTTGGYVNKFNIFVTHLYSFWIVLALSNGFRT